MNTLAFATLAMLGSMDLNFANITLHTARLGVLDKACRLLYLERLFCQGVLLISNKHGFFSFFPYTLHFRDSGLRTNSVFATFCFEGPLHCHKVERGPEHSDLYASAWFVKNGIQQHTHTHRAKPHLPSGLLSARSKRGSGGGGAAPPPDWGVLGWQSPPGYGTVQDLQLSRDAVPALLCTVRHCCAVRALPSGRALERCQLHCGGQGGLGTTPPGVRHVPSDGFLAVHRVRCHWRSGGGWGRNSGMGRPVNSGEGIEALCPTDREPAVAIHRAPRSSCRVLVRGGV